MPNDIKMKIEDCQGIFMLRSRVTAVKINQRNRYENHECEVFPVGYDVLLVLGVDVKGDVDVLLGPSALPVSSVTIHFDKQQTFQIDIKSETEG